MNRFPRLIGLLGVLALLFASLASGTALAAAALRVTYSATTIDEGSLLQVDAIYDGSQGDAEVFGFVWGDLTTDQVAPIAAATDWTASSSHAFADEGTYRVKVRVRATGDTFTKLQDIIVVNVAPVLDPLADVLAPVDGEFDLDITFTDPGAGDTHTVTVDWGDGSPADETWGVATGRAAFTHTYTARGPVTVTVTVDDGADTTVGTFTAEVTSACLGRAVTIDIAALGLPPGVPVIGTAAADVVLGTSGDDVVYGKDGDDLMCGLAGNDRLAGDAGADVIDGGRGDDLLFGGDGDDDLRGGGGNDVIRGGDGDDTLDGAAGKDKLLGMAGADHLAGGAGSDVLGGGIDADTLLGAAGNDRMFGGRGADLMFGAGGADVLDGGPQDDLLDAGPGDDRLVAGTGNDRLRGGDGDDYGDAGSGDDLVGGGDGDDRLLGGPGDDQISGGDGRDRLDGGIGADLLHGGDDVDVLDGDNGPDILRGAAGADHLNGGRGTDVLLGGGGNDSLIGGSRGDVLHGGPGRDTLRGGDGSDFLFNSEYPSLDIMDGQDGDDVVGTGKRGTEATGIRKYLTEAEALAFQGSYLLSDFTTYHDCCRNRVINIQTMANTLHGHLVMPGEIFSINDVVGRRTTAKGYKEAGAIIDGWVQCCAHGANVGGGTSQFATTIYNAIFFAGMEDIEHRPHSLDFLRYPDGREATMGYPYPDVSFRNNSAHPVLITTHHSGYTGTSIRVKFWGDNGGIVVTAADSGRRNISWTDRIVYTGDPALSPDQEVVKTQKSFGYTIDVYRDITYPDNSTTRETWTWRYDPGPEVRKVHPCKLPADSPEYTGEACPSDDDDDDGGGDDDPDPF